MRLDALEIGKDAISASVASDDAALRQHILDMGLTPGTAGQTPRASSSLTSMTPTRWRPQTPIARPVPTPPWARA